MGCDIHAYIEEKHDGRWQYGPKIYESDYRALPLGAGFFDGEEYRRRNCPIDDRNYQLFAFLAGVRGNATPWPRLIGRSESCTRGVPSYMSDEVREEYHQWGGAGHSFNWLTVEELITGFAASQMIGEADGFKDQLAFSLKQIEQRMKDADLKPSDIRIVFWFDN